MVSGPFSVDIVIPNLNGRHMLAGCLDSIRRQTWGDWRVSVVDNGSTDGSAEWLRKAHPEVRLIALGKNTGFSPAVNLGIRAGNRPLVFLLNNDTELAPDCLEQLVRAAETQPDHAFFAPRMLSFHQRHLLDGAGEGYLRGGAGYRLGTMEADGPPYDRARTVFGACAGAALYRREPFAALGWFDDDFFAYLEDVDLNLRAGRAGLRCRYVPAARVYHIGSATSGSKFNDLTIRLSTRNSLWVLARNYPAGLLLRWVAVIAVYQGVWLVFAVKKGQLRPYLAGLVEGLRGLGRMRGTFRAMAARSDNRHLAEWTASLCRAEGEVIDSIMRRRAGQGRGNRLLQLYRRIFL